MNKKIEKLINEALELPVQVRAYFAEKLLESLDVLGDVYLSSEWKTEIEKRCKDIDDGQILLREAEEVFNNAFEKINETD